jgi:Cytochrome c554 and c-prime
MRYSSSTVWRRWPPARAWAISVVLLFAGGLRAALLMPGTQPKEHEFNLRDVANCRQCHSRTTNGPADPFFSWQGGMMAQAARDPVFRAALAIANQDIKGVGEFCIRCHSPKAWAEGRSSAPDASLLVGDDLHGVSCDVCHHLVDPLSAEAKQFARQIPPGYGNGMIVIDPARTLRGPYGEPNGLKMHGTAQSAYHAASELCGTCHNVSNPTLATNVNLQPPHTFGHIERTYSEWALSDFAKTDHPQTCQSCHFPRVLAGGKAVNYDSRRGDQHRDYFVSHSAVGGSTWVQDAIFEIWKGQDVDRDALEAGKQHARALLQTAAALGLELVAGKARLTITNLTGHKLPTGYPEGRRMWVNVRFFGFGDRLLGEMGRYGTKKEILSDDEVKVPTLLDPNQTRVYECTPGISPEQAAKYGRKPGPSFHFILNDIITKDNRIPPRGYRRASFAEHLATPVAAEYADGQYWDELEFILPSGTQRVEARLMYQSVSWEYLKFLVEENRTDKWGKDLYAAWRKTGRCPPEEIAFAKAEMKP